MTMNPILLQELRARMRGGQAYLLLTTIILVFGFVTLTTFWALTNLLHPVVPFTIPLAGTIGEGPPPLGRLLVSQRAVIFFLIMSLWAVLLAALIVPGTTSGTIAREREIRSLPLLVATPVSPLALVSGKLIAAASYILLVLAAGIPLFSLVILFGGVQAGQVLAVGIIVCVTTFAFAALGVFVSSVARNGLLASLITYTIVIALTFGSYAVYLASSPLSRALSIKYALYFSPLAAVVSALTQTNASLNTIVSRLFREPGTHVAGEWWALGHYPLWQVTTTAYLVAGVLLLIAASRAINPLRGWL